jgi:hypothetical protein
MTFPMAEQARRRFEASWYGGATQSISDLDCLLVYNSGGPEFTAFLFQPEFG